MLSRINEYYFGSFGLVRGYGPLFRTLKEADESIYADFRQQRSRFQGSTDRQLVVVNPVTGLCWRHEEGVPLESLQPTRVATGEQASYPAEMLRSCELLWHNASRKSTG